MVEAEAVHCVSCTATKSFEFKILPASYWKYRSNSPVEQSSSLPPACLLAIRNMWGEGDTAQKPPEYAGICTLLDGKYSEAEDFLPEEIHRAFSKESVDDCFEAVGRQLPI